MQLLLPAFLVNMLTCPGGYLLNGIERPDLGMKAAFVAGAGNVLISSVLIGSFGYFGLVAGVALSLVLAAGYFVCMLHRTLPGIAGQWYWQVLRGPFFLSVAATGLLLLLDAYCRLTSIAALVLVGLSCLGAVLLLLARSNYLDPFERRVLFATFLLRRSS
jgi:O-antigen/teichoic acid export membrane protein